MRQQPFGLHRLTDASCRILSFRLLVTTAMTGVLPLVAMMPCFALPAGGQVVGGQAALNGDATSLTITQLTDRAILNWQNFDIGAGEHVAFVQPSGRAVA